MRIPESLFFIVNAVVRTLLRSPLHRIMSKNVLVITYYGRKSGRRYSTPVRYSRVGGAIRCLTAEQVQWWRNIRNNPDVTLLVAGADVNCRALIQDRDPAKTKLAIREILAIFPQDAVYQEIGLNADRSLDENDLEAASHKAIVVDFLENTGDI